jgi:hypothetical protein
MMILVVYICLCVSGVLLLKKLYEVYHLKLYVKNFRVFEIFRVFEDRVETLEFLR